MISMLTGALPEPVVNGGMEEKVRFTSKREREIETQDDTSKSVELSITLEVFFSPKPEVGFLDFEVFEELLASHSSYFPPH